MSDGLKIDDAQFLRAQLMLGEVKNGVAKVQARAVNKALAKARTAASKEVGKDITLKASRIKSDFKIDKATVSKPSAKLICKSEPVGLYQFSARQTKLGVSVKVKRAGQRKLLKHAFIARLKRGDTMHVFWRKYSGPRAAQSQRRKYAMMSRKYRFPIERLTGPRIADIFNLPPVMQAVITTANEAIDSNFAHELDYQLQGLRR